jgi:hypothetical protein
MSFLVNSFIYIIKNMAAIGAMLMKTGQTTSYRTGDDGDIEAGRATDFFTLASNNPFGNTNRFTDELGGSTYTNNWVIDWSTFDGSTVLGYYRTAQTTNTWDNAITNSLGTFGTFSGCYLPNRKELENIINISISGVISYAPLNITVNLWTSSTTVFSAGNAWQLNVLSGGLIDFVGKQVNRQYIPVRTFTVTGTTLS